MEVELRSPRATGFSLIEVLIASALLMAITLGTLPLFTRALRDNRSGAESTEVSNIARSQVEELFQLPWDAPRLVLTAGDANGGTVKVFGDFFSSADQRWKPCDAPLPVDCDPANCVVPVADPARWTRTTCIRQFSNDDVTDDGILSDGEALAFDATPSRIHLKEIVVRVSGSRQSPVFGPAKRLTVRTLKSQ
jgi:hypothetical protein